MTPQEKLLNRLSNVFGEPRVDDPAGYVEEVAKAIAGFDENALENAGNEVIRTCKFWPRPAEIVDAINSVLRSRHRVVKPMRVEEPQPLTPEALARVRELTDMAVKALDSDRSFAPLDPADLPRVDREAFQRMQSRSRNGLHVDHQALMRRITGERD